MRTRRKLLKALPEGESGEEFTAELVALRTDETALAEKWGDRNFAMNLKEDGTFSWNFSQGDQVTGIWGIDSEGILAMEMNDEGAMLAQVLLNNGQLDFYMLGDTQGSPPLHFIKGQM